MLFLRPLIASLLVMAAVAEAANLRQEQRKLQTSTHSDGYLSLVLNRVNQVRAAEGLPMLCMKKSQVVAQSNSDEKAANNYMDHKGIGTTTIEHLISRAGFDWSTVADNFEECDSGVVADTTAPTQAEQEGETGAPYTGTPVVPYTDVPAVELPEEAPAETVNPLDIPILRRRRYDS